MDDATLEEKLRSAAAGYDAASLIDAVWRLDQMADVSTLVSLAVPR